MPQQTVAQVREWMRKEFGPDSEARNEDGSPMTEEQLNACAQGWLDYWAALNSYFEKK